MVIPFPEFPNDLRHRDKEVCLPKISPSYSIYSPESIVSSLESNLASDLGLLTINSETAVGEGIEPSRSG